MRGIQVSKIMVPCLRGNDRQRGFQSPKLLPTFFVDGGALSVFSD
jgi:hypothetical protein